MPRRHPLHPVRPVLRLGAWIALLVLCFIRWLAAHIRNPPPLPRPFPGVGDINNHLWAPPVNIPKAPFGASMTLPSILEIVVDGKNRTCKPPILSEPVAGGIFSHLDQFRVNIAFSRGKARPLRPGKYADPRSQWFNVFLGYYQVDVCCSVWDRPFGYQPDPDGGFVVDPVEIGLLGRADWNFFSNYLYGVPADVLTRFPGRVGFTEPGRAVIGDRVWDHLVGADIQVASTYQAKAGERLQDTWRFINNLWRAAFGQPVTRKAPKGSFPMTDLDAELYVSHRKDSSDFHYGEPVYRTFVFGGTVNRTWADRDETRIRSNAAFLDLQMSTLRQVIRMHFPDAGFAPGPGETDKGSTTGGASADPEKATVLS